MGKPEGFRREQQERSPLGAPSCRPIPPWLRPQRSTFHGNWWLNGARRSWLSFSSRVPEQAACRESMRVQERGWEGTVCFQARLFDG